MGQNSFDFGFIKRQKLNKLILLATLKQDLLELEEQCLGNWVQKLWPKSHVVRKRGRVKFWSDLLDIVNIFVLTLRDVERNV